MTVATLLPPNGTPLLRALEQAVAYEPRVSAGVEVIAGVKGRQLPGFLQFLLWEYGLIELVPHIDNPYTLITEGRPWQIERDTFAAVARGLGWLNSPATIYEEPARRRWWNAFQLHLNALPPADTPTLDRITRVTRLGQPFRSDFRRGVSGYDGPALEAGFTRLGACRLSDDTGVTIAPGGAKWSFGRQWEAVHELTEAEGNALGIWLDPPDEEGSVPWSEMHFLWATASFPWASEAGALRQALMAAWFPAQRVHVALLDDEGEVIGYRRAGANRAVLPAVDGQYTVAGVAYSEADAGQSVIIRAMTDAGNGVGQTVAAAAIVVNGDLAPGLPPGRLWLEPGQLSGGVTIAETSVSIPLRATVRERITLLLRF